jgi:P27 family predicted phage terminase small subunit
MTQSSNKARDFKQITANKPEVVNDIKPVEAIPILDCPMELGPAARHEWERIVAELIAKGVLSRFDRGPLAAYCIAYGLAMEAAEMVHKHGAMIKSPNGFPMQSPYLSHLNQQVATMMRIATEFGFTPASRSRIFSWDQKNSLLLENVESDESKSHW